MKHILQFLSIIVIVFLSSCECEEEKQKEQQANLETEIIAVKTVLEKYIIASETKNIDLVSEIWANDEDIVIFGTDLDEKLVGWEQIQAALKKQFETFEEPYISVSNQEVKVSPSGQTAWFSEVLNYNFIFDGKPLSYENIRYTGVMEKRNDKWLIVQSHMSLPASEYR